LSAAAHAPEIRKMTRMNATRPTTRYRVVIPDTSASRALLLSTSDGWGLPEWVSDIPAPWENVDRINATLTHMLGLRAATVRALALDWDAKPRTSYYLIDNLDPGWQPLADARWVARDEAGSLDWRSDRERDILMAWFTDQPAPRRSPWYQPGWYAEASAWIVDELGGQGIALTGEVEQLRSWERSSVMRVDTEEGKVYFKAVPRQWGHEPGLTAWLGRRFSEVTPAIITRDEGGRRMLVREFDGRPLPETADIAVWERAYATLGRMQRELAGSLEDVERIGVPVHHPVDILDRIGAMLHDERRMRLGLDGGLQAEDAAVLQNAIPRLQDACRRLIDGPIPCSLDHGDFWPGNIFATDESVLLFDWSDATITHPFFSLVMAADEIDEALPGTSCQMIDAYLTAWTAYAPLDTLRTIFADAMLVAPLHQALMYRDTYLPAMEFPEELDRMTPHFLRWLARSLAREYGVGKRENDEPLSRDPSFEFQGDT
jgi:hypothetical protein